MRKHVILCIGVLIGAQAANSSPSGCLSITPSVTQATNCDLTGNYLVSCPCDKYLNELTVMYTGQSGALVSVYGDKNHHHLLMSFSNVQQGDLLAVNDGGKRLKKKLYFSVSGMPDAEIDTDCKGGHNSLPGIGIGQVYGDFIIEGYVDHKGNACSMMSLSGTCVCKKYLTQITMIYTGSSGVDISVYDDNNHHHLLKIFTNVQHGALLTVNNNGKHLKKKTYFAIQGMPDVVVNTDCKGSNNVIPFAAGNIYGDFTAAGYIDEKGNRCGITTQCQGDGAVSLGVSGGVAPYTIEWSDGSTAFSISGLCTGYYYFTVTDAGGCSVEDSVFVGCNYAASNPIEINGSVVDVPCSGTFFGRIELQVTGGVPPYHYSWSNGESTSGIVDLHPGIYTVTVTDVSGASATSSFSVKAASCLEGSRCFASPTLPNLVSADTRWTIDNNSQTVTIRTTFSKTFVDNTYGTNAVGWNNGHTFNMLAGSDHLQLVLYDVNGVKKMEFKTDYISASALAPSGYKSLGVTGGDGRMIFGNAADVLSVNSSLAENFNVYGYVLTSNSPATDTSYTPNPVYPNWIYEVWYDVTINLSAFGAAGFGYPDIVFVHASPSKTGHNSEPVEFPCPGCNLAVSGTSSPVTMCNSSADCDGSISLHVSGGGPPYSFLWSTGDTSQNISDLCAGVYYVTITDFGHCVVVDSFMVECADTCRLTIQANAGSVSCPGGTDGILAADVTNGTAPFEYLWSTGATSSEITGLAPGEISFGITVTDAEGCSQSLSEVALIGEPSPLSIHSVITDASCFGASDGSVTATVGGGTAPYQYVWSNGQSSFQCVGLTAGTYHVTATDAHGCTVADTVVVSQPGELTLGAVTTPPSCFNGNDGAIDLAVNGGTPSFDYTWSTGENAEDINSLSAGAYHVSVVDAHECSATLSIAVQSPQSIMIASFVDDVTCFGENDGSILITVTGGRGPYNYEWTDGISSEDLLGISAGNYSLTVTDDEGCTASETFTVSEPQQLTAVINFRDDVSCYGGNDGILCTQASGGTSPYAYEWSNGVNSACASGLSAGTYYLIVMDANGCSIQESARVNEPAEAMNATIEIVSPISCSGVSDAHLCAQILAGEAPYTFVWSGGQTTACVSGLEPGSYEFTVTDKNGCLAFSNNVTLDEPAPLLLSTVSDNANCFGATDGGIALEVLGGTPPYAFEWSNGSSTQDLIGVGAGSYIVTATDAHACTATASALVGQPGPMALGAVASPVTCFGDSDGSIDLTVQGGIPPYTYSWSTGDAMQDIYALPAGIYSVVVQDLNGCEATLLVEVQEPAPILLTSNITNVSTPGGTDGAIVLMASGGSAPYQYLWSTGDTSPALSGLAEGNYSVTVTDANGCTISDVFGIGANFQIMDEPIFLQAHPNPSNSLFYIDMYGNGYGTARLRVVDVFEREVITKYIEMKNGKASEQISLSDVPSGIYYVVVDFGGEMKAITIEKIF
ncbi:MAG TPA: T9SS type A sorting domain-containing protein [Chitinophagales bacterium]|nr:T9SS type A sorting domain-containing protein [Chitinophagales bacterium]